MTIGKVKSNHLRKLTQKLNIIEAKNDGLMFTFMFLMAFTLTDYIKTINSYNELIGLGLDIMGILLIPFFYYNLYIYIKKLLELRKINKEYFHLYHN